MSWFLSNQIVSISCFAIIGLCCCAKSVGPSLEEDAGIIDSSVADSALDDTSTEWSCGNGLIEPGEVCDDGNNEEADICSADCLSIDICPNGVLEASMSFPNRNNIEPIDLAKCRQINGTLALSDRQLSNLDMLSDLTSVEGDLIIGMESWGSYMAKMEGDRTLLKDIKGLRNLVSVGGDLVIVYNDDLTSLEGLNNLQTVGGDLIIRNNNLFSLDGLDQLTSIGGSFVIYATYFNIAFIGPSNLVRIGGDLVFNENITLVFTSAFVRPNIENGLEEIIGFDELVSIGGNLIVSEVLLDRIDAFGKLETIGGSLLLNTSMSKWSMFGNLSSIGGDIAISGNEILEQLSVPSKSISIGGNLFIADNAWLPTCQAQLFQEALREEAFTGQVTVCGTEADACGSIECSDDILHYINSIWDWHDVL